MTDDSHAARPAAWGADSYARFARSHLEMAAELVDATAVDVDDTVLDIGCGTGTVAITAARRGATVTGLDISSAMLAAAKANARIVPVDDITWTHATATALPFAPDRFDVVLSSLGHIYADPAADATSELLRVMTPGGTLGFTAWTPTGLYPILAGLVMDYVPRPERPDYTTPPFMWGDQQVVAERLESHATDLTFEKGTVIYPTLSPTHFWHDLATHSRPFSWFIEKVDDRNALREEVIDTITPYFDASRNAVELDYLQTTGTRTLGN